MSLTKNQIVVEVKGAVASGKTTIAQIIEKALNNHKIDAVFCSGEDLYIVPLKDKIKAISGKTEVIIREIQTKRG